MTAVQHGEAHNVGLIVHHFVQPKQREVLETDRKREKKRGGKEEKDVFLPYVMYVNNVLKKQEL